MSESSSNIINLDLHGDIINKYNVISLLGKGSYSRVWLVFNINDNKYYALKVQNGDDFDEGKDEIKTLKKIPSEEKYINQLVDYFVETRVIEDVPTNFICSVYDLCCGNLDGLARKGKYNKGWPEKFVKNIFKQLLNALHTVHYKLEGFHGDIKPDNILLKGYNNKDLKYINMYNKANFNEVYQKTKKEYMLQKKKNKLDTDMKVKIRRKIHQAIVGMFDENSEDCYLCDEKYINDPLIRLTDFGFFCHKEEQFHECFGTRYYMAPEIILMGECDEKVDIWALGCMLYELLTCEILFDPHSDHRGSTDFHHLEMIINLCGEFKDVPSKYFKNSEHYSKFFKNDKLKDIIYNKNFNNSINNKINEKLLEHKIDSPMISNLISIMLNLNPSKRPSIKELLKHQWLS
jgi:serine/threonine-protein kinase SRPK3